MLARRNIRPQPRGWLPFLDAGSGVVDVGVMRGAGAMTFTRATTATTLLSSGLLGSVASGSARSCYSPTGGYLGYLAEGARTNIIPRSQEFDNAAWTLASATVTANAVAAPDGTTTADRLVEAVGTAQHKGYRVVTSATTTPHSWSIFAKAAERSWNILNSADGAAGDVLTYFDATNGVVGTLGSGCVASIQSHPNSWFRNKVTRTTGGDATTYLQAQLSSADGVGSYAGDASKGAYFWGAQLEVAAFASSYIPTASAAVTRNADVASLAVSGNLGTNDESIAFHWTPHHAPSGTIFLWGTYVDANNYTAILHDATNIIARKRISGVNYDATKALAFVDGTTYRIGARFSSVSGVDVFVDRTKGTNQADTAAMQVGSAMQIGADGNGGNQPFASSRRFGTFGRALNDSEFTRVA